MKYYKQYDNSYPFNSRNILFAVYSLGEVIEHNLLYEARRMHPRPRYCHYLRCAFPCKVCIAITDLLAFDWETCIIATYYYRILEEDDI